MCTDSITEYFWMCDVGTNLIIKVQEIFLRHTGEVDLWILINIYENEAIA